jgi:hypothetical protein
VILTFKIIKEKNQLIFVSIKSFENGLVLLQIWAIMNWACIKIIVIFIFNQFSFTMLLTNAITCSFHISKLFDYKLHVLKLVGILAREKKLSISICDPTNPQDFMSKESNYKK